MVWRAKNTTFAFYFYRVFIFCAPPPLVYSYLVLRVEGTIAWQHLFFFCVWNHVIHEAVDDGRELEIYQDEKCFYKIFSTGLNTGYHLGEVLAVKKRLDITSTLFCFSFGS